jgi:hypothetical protein
MNQWQNHKNHIAAPLEKKEVHAVEAIDTVQGSQYNHRDLEMEAKRSLQTNPMVYPVDVFEFIDLSNQDLLSHNMDEDVEEFECACRAEFQNQVELEIHLLICDAETEPVNAKGKPLNGQLTFSCKICGDNGKPRGFYVYHDLLVHYSDVYGEPLPSFVKSEPILEGRGIKNKSST